MTIELENRDRESGFTLIELMIVVAIIGILAAVAIPNFISFQAKSKRSEGKVFLSGLMIVAKAFFVEHDYILTGGDSLEQMGSDMGTLPKHYVVFNSGSQCYGSTSLGIDPTYVAAFCDSPTSVSQQPNLYALPAEGHPEGYRVFAMGNIDSDLFPDILHLESDGEGLLDNDDIADDWPQEPW